MQTYYILIIDWNHILASEWVELKGVGQEEIDLIYNGTGIFLPLEIYIADIGPTLQSTKLLTLRKAININHD